MNVYASISGYGEFAELDKFTRAVAWEESYPNSEPLWTQLHQENKFTKQSPNIHVGISSMQLWSLKSPFAKYSLVPNRCGQHFFSQECISLEELYLSHNGISKMEGLSTLVNLRVLDVSSNKLTAVSDIENLTR